MGNPETFLRTKKNLEIMSDKKRKDQKMPKSTVTEAVKQNNKPSPKMEREKTEKPPSPKPGDIEDGVIMDSRLTPGTKRVIQERVKQTHDKGYTMEHDFHNNGPGVLMAAARSIANTDIHARIDQKPVGWNTYNWNKLAILSERERLAISASWMIAELDRYYFNDVEQIDKSK